ncbi:hypothetical protein NKH18_45280 [Streptomyces sp. M10(2022)]
MMTGNSGAVRHVGRSKLTQQSSTVSRRPSTSARTGTRRRRRSRPGAWTG